MDKSASLAGNAPPRRSTESLDEIMSSTSGLVWDVVETYANVHSAHTVAILLRAAGMPAEVVGDTSLLGDARRCELRVPPGLGRRARWLMSQAHFTDAELTFLATGELHGADHTDE